MIANPSVKQWLNMMRDAVFEVDDLFDEINTEALRCKVEAEYETRTATAQGVRSSSQHEMKELHYRDANLSFCPPFKIFRNGRLLVFACKTRISVALGGLLRTTLSQDYWDDVLKSSIWELTDDEVQPALLLSYRYPMLQNIPIYGETFPSHNFKILPPLGQLCNLKELCICGMISVKSVDIEFYGSDSHLFQPFSFLETLEFDNMLDWEDWKLTGGTTIEFTLSLFLRDIYYGIGCPLKPTWFPEASYRLQLFFVSLDVERSSRLITRSFPVVLLGLFGHRFVRGLKFL
ncbi:putative CC-NBS-LRR resistance protein [Trifolium pratense]|uniref:Putative CC-NBS-LRR resistance protein n=1 Tax=Trifolium pratense TaxID=57577 RepID=A0A2K3MT99_TRIPR|nr:putative CC-NBS-LRR resistance protein [Trifolium pratense]